MAVYQYRKFKVSLDDDSKKSQGLHVGDIVRRQYMDSNSIIYSLMCVLEVGKTVISETKSKQWFIGALLDGDVPKSDELLDFVRVTNLWDANRLGALYLTSSDDEAPYIDVIDGIGKEKSLCYPSGLNDLSWKDDFYQYGTVCGNFLTASYNTSVNDVNRICKLVRNNTTSDGSFFGIKQNITKKLSTPSRVLIAYKSRASRQIDDVKGCLEYTDESKIDGSFSINFTTEWKYQLHVVTLENTEECSHTFKLDLTSLVFGDSIEIADFNIILLSSISNFVDGMKMRIGKLNGVSDPVFGNLEDYGVYAQRFYATKQVNISGTITAGDENGFGCTFYAGKIHKNVVINSLACDFETSTSIVKEASPVGSGEVYSSQKEIVLNAQTNSWMKEHLGKQYCFSFWAKNETSCKVLVSQNDYSLKTIELIAGDIWRRYTVPFVIQEGIGDSIQLQMKLLPSAGTLLFTAPQIESGSYATQYQATDDVLSYVEDYGAWFSKGGIGGTIQNPLLKLNSDGSISTKNNSFNINGDGTGSFANGRFSWTKDSIVLKDVVIKWESLDDTTKEEIKPKSINITGTDTFLVNKDVYTPSSITLELQEVNFTSSSSQRKWYYLGTNNTYTEISGENGKSIAISPTGSYWNSDILTIKCCVTLNSTELADTIVIQKKDSYVPVELFLDVVKGSLVYRSTQDFVATLNVSVEKGGKDITSEYNASQIVWSRESEDTSATDEYWNKMHKEAGTKLDIHTSDLAGNTAIIVTLYDANGEVSSAKSVSL